MELAAASSSYDLNMESECIKKSQVTGLTGPTAGPGRV
ncbi:hypothetical protein CCACVL1_05117 [Corchorus capsularis]|uniref:Uncharacterized protein n=1 Tax=Corchorus capsularis TaxID=210143 RepID=A0A1R3JMI4_COCAP|nr:hypothetical protein CCACVL1_05117 [Corchorus capsularis]